MREILRQGALAYIIKVSMHPGAAHPGNHILPGLWTSLESDGHRANSHLVSTHGVCSPNSRHPEQMEGSRMNDSSSKERLAYSAATLYYQQSKTMEEVSRILATSRSSVSRLLSYARKTGIIEIRLHGSEEAIGVIQRQVSDIYGVTAYVIPGSGASNPWERTINVARQAGRIIPALVDPGNVLGVAWGTTIAGIARYLKPRSVSDVTIVQLNGSAHIGTFGIGFAGDILSRFAETFGGSVEPFPVPAFFDNPDTRDAMWRERSVQRVLSIQERMDVALFGIGSPTSSIPSHVYRGGYMDAADRSDLSRQRVAGDVATVFFRSDGSEDGIELNRRSSGPSLDVLRRTPRRVCVVGDPSRLDGTRGALAAGLVTDLIVDEQLASKLVKADERSK